MAFHENQIMAEGASITDLADSSLNPTDRQIYHLHSCWRSEYFGPVINPFEKLQEKIPFYEEQGSIVRMNQNHPWAILVVTPVMSRTQKLQAAKEMIFMDSTSSCETTRSTITTLLVATKAGAIPIAVFIHEGQTADSYKSAFELLKVHCPLAFAGSHEGPRIFMTDDSAAEKSAITEMFPSSVQLLCQFHVAQAHWRWLLALKDTTLEERKRLMKLSQEVMYANTEEIFFSAVNSVFLESGNHPRFVQRMIHYFLRRNEWVTYFRLSCLTRNHNTNNFSEASMRVIKDIILCRTKAFNIVALVEYFISVWDVYLSKRLLKHSYGRAANDYLLYSSLQKKMTCYTAADVIRVGDDMYLVPSEDTAEPTYTVDVSLGTCSCHAGQTGAFCKHQCFLYDALQLNFVNAPAITTTDRHMLAQLAVGEKCPSISFFSSFKGEGIEASLQAENIEMLLPIQNDKKALEPVVNSSASLEDVDELIKVVTNLKPYLYQVEKSTVRTLLTTLNSIDSSDKLNSVLSCFNKSSLSVKRQSRPGRKIKVQPTSISRRRLGVTRGSSKIPSGRPPKGIIKKIQKKSRPLCIRIKKKSVNTVVNSEQV